MSSETISLGDIGTDLQITITENGVPANLSSASAIEIELIKPDGQVLTKSASFITDGLDGKIRYITVADDIDQIGTWSYRGIVTFSPAQIFHSIEPKEFKVI